MSQLPEKQEPQALNIFSQKQDRERYKKVLGSTGFVPMLILQQNNPFTKDRESGVRDGDFTLGPERDNLGNRFLAVPGYWRPHARYTEEGQVKLESFDDQDEVFGRIGNLELELKGNKEKKIAKVGVDWLFWLPVQGRFATLFIAGSARADGEVLFDLQGKIVEVTSRFVESRSFSWFNPRFQAFEDDPPAGLKLPDQEHLKLVERTFLQRKTNEPEGRPR